MNKIFASSRQYKTVLKVLCIILIGVVQITLMPSFSIYGAWPNLILLLALVLIFFNNIPEAFLVASLGGLILDLASPLFFGFYTSFIILVLFLNKLLIGKYLSEAPLFVVAIILGVSVAAFDLILSVFAHQFFGIKIIIDIIYSIIIGLIFYQFLFYQNRRFQFLKFKE